MWAHASTHVAPIFVILNFNHRGAQICQVRSTKGSCTILLNGQYSDASQWQVSLIGGRIHGLRTRHELFKFHAVLLLIDVHDHIK